MEEKESLLANLFASMTEEVREEILTAPIEELLRESLKAVGLYVFSSTLDYEDGDESTGTVKVANDGMPERAKAAVEEVLRFYGITEFDWSDYPSNGQVSVCWELCE